MSETMDRQQDYTDLYRTTGTASPTLGFYVGAIWRRKWLVFLMIILVAGAGIGYTYLQPPVYRATALLIFGNRSQGAFRADAGERITGNFVTTQIPLITRASFLREIAAAPELSLAKSPMFSDEPDLLLALQERLHVSRQHKNTDILSISMEGEQADIITKTINHIADRYRAQVEDSREASASQAVREYTGKMRDTTSQANMVNQAIWRRANSAKISGLTFGVQQQDGRVIAATFQRQRDLLLGQLAVARRELDKSEALFLAKQFGFRLLCDTYARSGKGKPGSKANGSKTPVPVSTKKNDSTSDGEGNHSEPIITAAMVASAWRAVESVESEINETGKAVGGLEQSRAFVAKLQQKRDKLESAREELIRRYRVQQLWAPKAQMLRTKIDDKITQLEDQIELIENELSVRRKSLTPDGFDKDPVCRALTDRRITLEAQLKTQQEELAHNPDRARSILVEAPSIGHIEQLGASLRALRLASNIHGEELEKVQADLDALTGPLTDILTETAKLERLQLAYQRMEDWVREVKLALSQIRISVYDASKPTRPIRPIWKMNITFSAVFGIALACVTAILLELARKTIRTPGDVKQALGMPLIGVVPHFRLLDDQAGSLSVATVQDPDVAEAYNDLRLTIHSISGKETPRSILVTSATTGEGKSTTATMMAYAFAHAGERVLLVDGNLRAPYLHKVFDCSPTPGLCDALRDGQSETPCFSRTSISHLYFMPAGRTTTDGIAWLHPREFARFIRAASDMFDRIILDAPAAVGVADVRAMASCVDGVLYVVQSEHCKRGLVSRSLEAIRGIGADVLGVVLNNASYTKGDHFHFRKRSSMRGSLAQSDELGGEANSMNPTSTGLATEVELRQSFQSWMKDVDSISPKPKDSKDGVEQ
jgi:capsular exopolysaccharide synthesis family protein